ncbi:MAG: hypothetical protein ACRDI2_27050, partial [Chloroflexota bacterium]
PDRMTLRTPLPYEEGRTFCPDCEQWIVAEAFVAHRERAHPPTTISLTNVGDIRTAEAFGWQDD